MPNAQQFDEKISDETKQAILTFDQTKFSEKVEKRLAELEKKELSYDDVWKWESARMNS